MILSLFKTDQAREAAEALYRSAVEAARAPYLYETLGAPDTVEGRFEMVSLHVYLILRHLRGTEKRQQRVSQLLFDVMFQNMDDQLRELGVGDLSIGRKIRKMAENFYGRASAYEPGLDGDDVVGLAAAMGRNIFADEAAAPASGLAEYASAVDKALGEQPATRIANGIVVFPDLAEKL